jgi:uncharacterized protein YgiM (DUF1202 family)
MPDEFPPSDAEVASRPLSQKQRMSLSRQLAAPPPSLLPGPSHIQHASHLPHNNLGPSDTNRMALVLHHEAQQELQLIAANPDMSLPHVEQVLGLGSKQPPPSNPRGKTKKARTADREFRDNMHEDSAESQPPPGATSHPPAGRVHPTSSGTSIDGVGDVLAQMLQQLQSQMQAMQTQLTKLDALVPMQQQLQTLNAKIDSLTGRLEKTEQAVTQLQQENAQLRNTVGSNVQQVNWMQDFLADQFHAVQRAQVNPIQRQVVLRPTQNFPDGLDGFAQLTEQDVQTKLDLAESETCVIVRRVAPRQNNGLPRQWSPGQPCEMMVVELQSLTTKRDIMARANKEKLATVHNMQVYESLLDNEMREKKHLQASAMGHLINMNYRATWRRSQITWFVEAKNNFALLSGFDVPPGATPQQVQAAAHHAEERTQPRLPRTQGPGPNPTGTSAGVAGQHASA